MKQDDFDKRLLADFARAVINLHRHYLDGEKLDHELLHNTQDRWTDIHKVATGLTTLQKLADQELTRVLATEGLLAVGKSGLREVIALLDALTTGTRHPVFDLVDGLRSIDRCNPKGHTPQAAGGGGHSARDRGLQA